MVWEFVGNAGGFKNVGFRSANFAKELKLEIVRAWTLGFAGTIAYPTYRAPYSVA